MAAITSADLTIHGRVNSLIQHLYVDGVEIPLNSDNTFSHTFSAPVDAILTFTTIDNVGLSESRAVRVNTTDQAALLMTPPSAAG